MSWQRDDGDWWQGHGNQSWHSYEDGHGWQDSDWRQSGGWSHGQWDLDTYWDEQYYGNKRNSWTSWSGQYSDSTHCDSMSNGKWWETPQGSFWGHTLDAAIEWGRDNGGIIIDKEFCQWWSDQGSKASSSIDTQDGVKPEAEKDQGSPEESGRDQCSTDSQFDHERNEGSTAGKIRYGKDSIPEYDGSSTMREYRRRVKPFESVTSISPQFRAGRLLERLSGQAWKAAETLDIDTIRQEEGVSVLLDHLEKELEPLEYMKTFQVLSYFYNQFRRQRGEQKMSNYDTSFRIQCEKLQEVGSPLEGTSRAWWFLQKAGINDEIRQKVVAAPRAEYDYLKLRQALVAIIPDVNKLEPPKPPDPPGKGQGHRHWQNRKSGSSFRVNAVAEANEEDEEENDDN